MGVRTEGSTAGGGGGVRGAPHPTGLVRGLRPVVRSGEGTRHCSELTERYVIRFIQENVFQLVRKKTDKNRIF